MEMVSRSCDITAPADSASPAKFRPSPPWYSLPLCCPLWRECSGGSVHNRKNVFSKRFIPIGIHPDRIENGLGVSQVDEKFV